MTRHYLAQPPTFASDAQCCQFTNERGDALIAHMVNNMFVRATATIEHDRDRMTARDLTFNSGRESWSWLPSRKLPCVVDHATYLMKLTPFKSLNLARLLHMGRHGEDECLPNRCAKVKTSRSRTSRRRTHNLQ